MGINDKTIYFSFPSCLPSIEVTLLSYVINRIAVFENISKFNTYFIKNAFCVRFEIYLVKSPLILHRVNRNLKVLIDVTFISLLFCFNIMHFYTFNVFRVQIYRHCNFNMFLKAIY